MIIYQVYPRSFFDANNDGIGDLAGIEKKLSYIKSLGVDAIWISPFFKSPMKDFGYDVADYREVDPIFGTMDDFKKLLRSAKALDLGIIVDMVISHTSEEHPWFVASRAKEGNKSDWYLWADPKPDGTAPNNWVSVFGGPAWQWDAGRRQYYFHSFLPEQPDLNMHSLDVQDQVLAEMRFWLEMGVSGFRFDACNHIFQDLQLRSNPPRQDNAAALHPYGYQVHVYDQAQPEMLPFLERIRSLLDEYGAFSLAEVGGHDALKLMGEYTGATRLHSAYSFAMMRPESSAAYVRNVIATLEEHIRPPANACYAMSNHDKPRVATRWLNGRDREQFTKEMLALLFTMHGDICLYQGEELGLPEAEVPFERLQDPFGKNFWPKFKGRDGCRTPMPWTNHVHGGFSEVEPWLPLDEIHRELNINSQEMRPHSVLNFAREMIALRKARPELDHGSLRLIDAPEGVLAFSRQQEGRELVCLFNMDVTEKQVPVPTFNSVVLSRNATAGRRTASLDVCGFCLLEAA
ncbi:MAG TPA: alpha-glucosidase [Noviherbaspirillum sp.]|uniref:alpha-glucosidase n=1 Tax=Noviherbaspirillum sp. TaxID=1926288 RepID=UPI002B4A983D|nr:alpha-glucosidase [Noviherbaspirillum sp.]HJV87620.1 alpha-glucosidase [Noviherbaspirillum sp.]